MPHLLNLASLIGLPLLAWGLIELNPWPTVWGMVFIIGAKLWYIDRMAIFYDDVVMIDPRLRYVRPKASLAAGNIE